MELGMTMLIVTIIGLWVWVFWAGIVELERRAMRW